MKWMKHRKFSRIIIAGLLLTMTAWLLPTGLWTQKAEAATTLKDPRVVEDSSMEAGQKVTWDCVWFGSYPQSEVVCENDSEAIANLEAMDKDFGVEYIKVSQNTWNSIVNASYDSNGDANVGKTKYRRIKKTDATYSTSNLIGWYNWTDSTTYHYFKYEPIKWRVLKTDGKDAFLLADKALDDQLYHAEFTGITWEKSTIRKWLNEKFMNTAFSSNERDGIKMTNVINDRNINYGTKGGNNTNDKIFLLSEEDVYNSKMTIVYGFTKDYSNFDEGRKCKSSVFAKAMGVWSDLENCRWWLRSPGDSSRSAVYIKTTGGIYRIGTVVDGDLPVRPALHLDLSSSDLYSYAGTVCSDGTQNEVGGGTVTPDQPVITEDQLFGEYASYLNNQSYKNMCGEIRNEVDDILWSRSKMDNGLSALKSCMKAGAWSNLRSIISGFSGKFFEEKKLEEALALELVQDVAEDENVSQDIMDDVKRAHKIDEDINKGVGYAMKHGFKNADRKVKVAEQLSGGLFTKNDILVLIESAEAHEDQWNRDLKNLGIAVDSANMAINIALTMEANHEIVTQLMESVDKDTPLYRGLSRIDKKLKHTAVENVIPELLEYGIDKCGGFLVDAASGAFAPVEFGFMIIGAMIPLSGIEDINKTVIAASNTTQLSIIRDDLISKIILNYRNGGSLKTEDLKSEYKLMYSAYLSSLDSSVAYASKIATDKQKRKLKKDYDRIKKSLTYENYIESCLANANADWSYEVRNGKAVVKGYTIRKKNSSKKSASLKAAKEGGSELGYSMDIPEKIDGYDVEYVNEEAFKADKALKCITIPDPVDELGSGAFASCSNLDSVYMGSGLKTIGSGAFEDCSALSNVKLPYAVENIGEDAFAGTTDLVIEAQRGSAGETYAEKNNNVTFENVESRAVSISVETKPEKISYGMSEDIDPAGMTVKARYEDGTEKDVTKYCSSTFIDKKPGTVSVEVRFDELTETYDVEVTADPCEYRVRYENECGDEIADQTTGRATAGEKVTLTAPEIKGYTVDEQELTKVIGADDEFVITYTSKPKKSLKNAEVAYQKECKHTGKQIRPDVKITYDKKTLKAGEDYYIDYNTNTDPGKGVIMICGMGDYVDDLWLEFDIVDGSVFEGKNMVRFAGDTRYETALKTADALKKSLNVDKFSDIIVADGNNYPDALAGSYLAKVKKAPLVLVDRSVASEKMIGEYIEKNLSDKGTVYLLGGSDVMTERFEKSLKDVDVKRLAGDTRYETNLEILNEAKASKEDLLACTGEGFADSLSASAVGKPILLVDNRGLTKAQKTYMDKANVQDIYLIGGADVVSDKVGKELKSYDKDSKTERIAGDNRYKTSVAVAKAFFPDKCDTAVLAYGMKFPDGLAGGPLAISMGSPLLLVEDTAYADAKAYGSSVGISRLAVLGGTDVISDATAKRILP